MTGFALTMAAAQLLVRVYSGLEDVSLSCVASGRDEPELERMLGYFQNLFICRGKVDLSATLADWLHGVQRTLLDGLAHSGLPFNEVVNELKPTRSASHHALAQISVDYFAEKQASGLSGQELDAGREEKEELRSTGAKFDAEIYVRSYPDGMVSFSLVGAESLFAPATLRLMLNHLVRLFELVMQACVIREERERSVGSMLAGLLSGEEEANVLELSRGRQRELEASELSLQMLFERQARERGAEIAIRADDENVTFAEWLQRSRAVAKRLLSSYGTNLVLPLGLSV